MLFEPVSPLARGDEVMTSRIALPILLSLALFPACKNRDEGNSPEASNLTVAKPMEATPAAPSTTAPSSPQMAAKTPQATPPAATAPRSQVRLAKPRNAEPTPATMKKTANKPPATAAARSWDIGESMKPMSNSDQAEAKALGPEVRALAAPIPDAPAEHRRTAFVTIHPAIRIRGNTHLTMPRALTDAM